MADLLRSLLKGSPWKSQASGPEIGILSFEVASLMSKLANLWHCLEDGEIIRLKEEFANSVGIKMFVSEDVDYLMDLAVLEVMENLGCVARAVVLLGRKCDDPTYHNLKPVFEDPGEINLKWSRWEYRLKKMERKVKKMERFVAATSQLYQELEVLAELEQTLRRMRANPEPNHVKLYEFQQKVMWQRQEIKNLRDMSPWVRTYDYTVRLLLRSIFTIFARIKLVRGVDKNEAGDKVLDRFPDSASCLVRSSSLSASLQSSSHPSQRNQVRCYSAHLGRNSSNLESAGEKNRTNYRKLHRRKTSMVFGGKHQQVKSIGLARVGPFKGCMPGSSDSPVLATTLPSISDILSSNGVSTQEMNKMRCMGTYSQPSKGTISSRVIFPNFSHKIIIPSPSTLGHAALTLRYANIIILIEKLIAAPHLISMDARDDLYNMLPASIRASLRKKLKLFTKTYTSSVYDAALAAEWRLISSRILDWLLPLAYSTIKWHSERNFEKQHMTPGTNVLLVQTLYFADQVKTEAATTELLMGLTYISRYCQEHKERPSFLDSSCKRPSDVYLYDKINNSHSMINEYM
ncbi:OLC1v1034351C1 [Oldenlandia corymbosa var. corymbosa]|uniref:OLC1v1034351C1 n=1 Tax=Oldenlandia corymbosa var. corymbosa TaxID=529605 RepID=A0AAV1CQK1_OLDCO|nr:OLC1v1034351C1 [Oldenlandia corymbosa var. corymbosa]